MYTIIPKKKADENHYFKKLVLHVCMGEGVNTLYQSVDPNRTITIPYRNRTTEEKEKTVEDIIGDFTSGQ